MVEVALVNHYRTLSASYEHAAMQRRGIQPAP